MSSTRRSALCALITMAALFAAASSQAQSPFDGTWKTDLSKTKFSPKPLTFYTSAGWYHCVSCTPAYDVQADGQDHAVSGQSYDTMSVTIVDPHTISIVAKKGKRRHFRANAHRLRRRQNAHREIHWPSCERWPGHKL